MLKQTTYSCIVASALCVQSLVGQDVSTTMKLESIAARAAVEHSLGTITPSLRIVVDPTVVFGDEAPGTRARSQRTSARNATLTKELGGRVESRGSVMDCSVRPCILRNADIFVSISEPVVNGDGAKVTVTTFQQGKRQLHYQTLNVLMKREAKAWKVVEINELGVS